MQRTMQVLDFLSKSQRQAKGKQPNGRSQNLATITYEVCVGETNSNSHLQTLPFYRQLNIYQRHQLLLK